MKKFILPILALFAIGIGISLWDTADPREEYSSNIMKMIFAFMGDKEYLLRNLYIICAFLIIINIVSGIFSFIKVVFSNRSSEKIAKKIKDMLFDHLQNLPFEYHSRADKGDLIQRCTSDVETVRSFLSTQFVEVLGSILSILFVFASMLTLNVKLTLISLIFIPFIFLFTLIFFSKIKVVYKRVEEAEGKMSNVVQENINGTRVVKAFGQEKNELEKFDNANNDLYEKSILHVNVMSKFWSITEFLSMLQVGILTLAGVILSVKGEITVGILAIFLTYEWIIVWPVKQVGMILGDLGKTIVSVDRINEVLSEDKKFFRIKRIPAE